MLSGLKEEFLSNKKYQVKVRCCRGATVEDISDYLKPILKRKPDYVVLHVGTINAKNMGSRNILDKLLQLKTVVLDSDENCKVILYQPVTLVDDGKAGFTISNRSNHQRCSVKKSVLRNFAKFTGNVWTGFYMIGTSVVKELYKQIINPFLVNIFIFISP